jgi:tetratricopeptide (TPR) repeat protein
LLQVQAASEILSRAKDQTTEWERAHYDALLLQGRLLKDADDPGRGLTQFGQARTIALRIAAVPDQGSRGFDLKLAHVAMQEAEALINLGQPIQAAEKSRSMVTEIRQLVASSRATQAALVQALGNLAWYAIIGNAPREAVDAADEAIAMDREEHWIGLNRGHALLALDQRAQAIEQYRQLVAHPRADGRKWSDVIASDLTDLAKAGVSLEPLSEGESNDIAKVEQEAVNEK